MVDKLNLSQPFNPKIRKTTNEDSLDLLDLWPWLHGATYSARFGRVQG